MKKIVFAILISLLLVLGTATIGIAADPILTQSITLEPETAKVSLGKTLTLKANIEPKNVTSKNSTGHPQMKR